MGPTTPLVRATPGHNVYGFGGGELGGEEALIADCGYPGITKGTKHKTKQLKPMSEINVAVDSAARRDFLPLGL